jgi:transcriptional regulator with XRE-family HTH domain
MSATHHKQETDSKPEAFGRWVRRYRTSRGWTVREVGDRGGLSHSNVTWIELGAQTLDARAILTYVHLSKGLELDLGYVLERAGYDLGNHKKKETECPQQP